jgi:hypothetical protein
MIFSSTVDWGFAAQIVAIVGQVAVVALLALVWRRQRLCTRSTLTQFDRLILAARVQALVSGHPPRAKCEIVSLAERP